MRPEAIARISRLDLRARAVVDGALAGLHRSPCRGESVEFRQHREYVPGDDPRRVDWKVWGRQDRLYVKEHDAETTLQLTLLVDGSASMDYPGIATARPTRPSKYESAATLAASLAWLALSRGDAVGCSVFDDRLRAGVPPRTRRSHVASVCDVLEAPREAAAGDFLGVLRTVAESLPRRGMVIVASDLLGEREDIFRGLRMLRARGHDLAVLHVLDDDEIDFPFTGPTRFDGLEHTGHVACDPRSLREGYRAAVEAFLADVRRRAAACRCDYALVRTGEPLDAALAAFLSRRSGRTA